VVATGGPAGIGQVTADAFVAAGARVFVCDADSVALAEALRRQPVLSGSCCDISDPRAVEELLKMVDTFLRIWCPWRRIG